MLAQHIGVYGGFVHLASWVAVHLLIDAGGIIALIEGQLVIGFFLLACGTALLIWTIATTHRAATDAREKAGNPPSG
jgi:threonine/homoserine/homoserine lactone efflux protein